MSVINKRRLSVNRIIKTAVLISAVIVAFIFGLTMQISVAGSYVYNDIDSLKNALVEASAAVITENETVNGVQFNSPEIAGNSLIILSNSDPVLYADWTIKFNDAQVDLTGAYGAMTFQGLGGDTAPFCGALQMSVESVTTFIPKLNRALFKVIDIKATLPGDVRFNVAPGSTLQTPVFAETVTRSTQLSVAWSFMLMSQNNAAITTGGLIGTVDGGIQLTAGLSFSNISVYNVNVAGGNAGGICNTLGSGSSLTVTAFSPSIAINVTGTNAGTVVGRAESNATVTATNLSPTGTVAVTGTKAGGIIGSIGSDATVNVGAFSPTRPVNISGSQYAGGLAGEAETDSTVDLPNGWGLPIGSSVTVTGEFAGGLFGQFTDGSIDLDENVVALDNKTVVQGKNVGGVFGRLSLSASYSIPSLQYNTSNRITLKNNANNSVSLGGIVGQLEITNKDVVFSVNGTSRENKLNIYTSINSWSNLNNSAGGVIGYAYATDSTGKNAKVSVQNVIADMSFTGSDTLYNGGIIGKLGNATNGIYALIDGCDVITNKPSARSYGFGGAVAHLNGNTVLKVNDFTLNTNNQLISGAGVVSRANVNDVVCLSGTLNLLNAKYGGSSLGQIIGLQKNSLIYAENSINLTRGTGSVVVNDIGNYGSVIRLGGNPNLSPDLFTIGTYNRIVLKTGAMYTYASNTATVADTDQFVVLSCSIQNNMFLPGGVSADANYENITLLDSNIVITGNINLTNTGVFSLMRDVWESNNYNFTGTINGNNNTITLDSGTPWGTGGVQGSIDGSIVGIDRHNGSASETHSNFGFLRSIKSNVTIQDLHFNGEYQYTSKRAWTKAGVLIAYGDQKLTVNNVSFDVDAYFAVDGGNNYNEFGIIIGSCLNSGSNTLTVTNCTVDGTIYAIRKSGANLRFGCITGVIYGSGYQNINITNTAILAETTFNGNLEAALTIGRIESGSKTVKLDRLSFGTVDNEASLTTTNYWNRTGCLLGSYWFADVEYKSTVVGQYGLDAKNISITTSNNEIGGLCGTALGWWKVFENGIRLDDFDLDRGNGGSTGTGLLVYYGVAQSGSALYLELQSSNSYVITENTSVKSGNLSNYDELVCWLYEEEYEFVNGQSIISIETVGSAPIDTTETPNTYVNRTKNSRNNANSAWNSNPNSRYYYNLFSLKSKGSRTKGEDLLIWSVFQYANSKIRQCCTNKTWDNNSILNCNSVTEFDLSGLSYYPVDTSGITVKNAIIRFNNSKIETAEDNRTDTTKMLTKQPSQHYMMHSGLFYNASGNVTVNNVTFRGNIIYSSDMCGVLIGNTLIAGADDEHKNTLTVNGLKLDGICLNGYTGDDYAPLLINKIGEYTVLDMQTVYTVVVDDFNSYDNTGINETWHAASSLIGNIGFYDAGNDTGARGITLSFSDIRLDGRTTKGAKLNVYDTYRTIFSRSTFINSFMYKENCSGTYNFTKEEDWDGNNHIRHVTYGKEISESTKNPDEQLRYYDSEFYVNANAEPDKVTANNFDSYQRYVYARGTGSYEIDVNLTIYVFVDGCGTYGDPYVITRGGQVEGLEYFLVNDKPKNGVIICIYNGNTDTVHITSNDANHKYYKYNANAQSWEVSDTSDGAIWTPNAISTAQLLEHMRTAYYYIDNDIALSGFFTGLGTGKNPFSGVIVGNGSDIPTVTIEGNQVNASAPKTIAANGLINVAKGCVIKNIHIVYENDGTVTVANETAPQNFAIADYFGGVIGYVMGGDNIVDGVTVSLPNISVTLTANGNHLCTVGGMVGVINNGGVVFRGTNTVTGLDARFNGTAYTTLYFNPYVGRVLDGYAFADLGSTVNNNDKQYKIPTLTGDTILVSGQTVTVNSAEDLYLLSALINSGAIGSKDASKPTGYDAKSRFSGRATYNNVKPASVAEAEADYTNAKKDNTGADGSYLFTFINGMLNGTSTYTVNFGGDITFVGSMFDGTTFRGIGSRYGSPLQNLSVANTQNRTLCLAMISREYVNDNFVGRGIGFINQLGAFSNTSVDLTLTGSVNALNYNTSGTVSAIGWAPVVNGGDAGREAGVGGFVGYVSTNDEITINGVTLGNGLTVSGSYCIGGLVGMKEGTGVLNIRDCLTNGVQVNSDMYAGGLAGLSTGTVNVKTTANEATYRNITVTYNDLERVGNYTAFGGFFGFAKVAGIGEDGKTIHIVNLDVINTANKTNTSVGGLIGNSDQSALIKNAEISDIHVEGKKDNASSGGVIGKISNKTESVMIDTVTVDIGGSGMVSGLYSGGYIGNYDGRIQDGGVAPSNVTVQNGNISGAVVSGKAAVGGIVGYSAKDNQLTVTDVSVDVSSIELTNDNVDGYVGGVLGHTVNGTTNISNVRIAENYSVTVNGNRLVGVDKTVTAGGIIGCIDGANAVIDDTEIAKMNCVTVSAQNGFAGGVVGDIKGGKAIVNGFETGDSANTDVRLVVGKLTDGVNTVYSGSSGGVIGLIDENSDVGTAISGAILYNTEIYADNVAGGVIGIGARNFSVKDSALIGITANGSKSGSGWTSSSAFVGRLSEGATVDGYNLLLNGISVQDSQADPKQGLWVGSIDRASCSIKLIGVSAVNVEPLSINDVNGSCTVNYIIYTDFDADGDPTRHAGAVRVSEHPKNSTVIGTAENAFTLFGNGAAVKTTGSGTVSFPAYVLGQIGRRGYTTTLANDNMSTFGRQHTDNPNDFSVFLIMETESNTLTDLIMNYADFITSGGAREYWNIDQNCISVDTYAYVDGHFIRNETATLTYHDGSFALNGIDSRDSDKEQFTLVTFTFSNDSVTGYKLYIPIIITKPVEVVIDVGISQGSVFRDSLVNNEDAIIEYGKRATLRINYKYFYDNWNASDLNWSYSKDISLTNIIENIPESMKLPAGTYITLIDVQAGDSAYSYAVEGESISKILASSFEGFAPQNMGALLKAELAADVNDEYALWVKDDFNPNIIVDGEGYRKKTAGDDSAVYVISCEETYFIVIELPDVEGVDVQYRSIEFLFDGQLNGGFANVVTAPINNRNLKVYKDPVQGFTKTSESLNGANASLIQNGENEIVLLLNSVLELNRNVVTPTTKRYMQFDIGLQYFNSISYGYRGSVKITPIFEIIREGEDPILLNGKIINMNYNGQKQITIPVNNQGVVIELAAYTNMGQRQVVVNTTLTFEFTHQAAQSMFPMSTLNNGIPGSYLSFDPTMVISDNENFFGGNRQKLSNLGTLTKYYRGSEIDSLLELVANSSQLAINPGAASEPENGNAIIDANGIMNMVGYENELEGVNKIIVTVRLYQKDNAGEYQPIDDVSKFLSSVKIGGVESLGNSITRTIPKGEDGSYDNLFEDAVFNLPLKLEVKRKPLLDDVDIMYANYKVEMKVEFYCNNERSAGSTDYFIYTLAKIAEDF